MAVDPDIVEAVSTWLSKPPPLDRAIVEARGNQRFGVVMTNDGIQAMPGGLPLFYRRRREPPILPVDYAFDVRDDVIDILRSSIVTALEECDVEFIPVSTQAFSRIGSWDGKLELIERIGLQCVFGYYDDRVYLSSYDLNEDPPLYFLCRLPHRVASIAEALESLQPPSVKEALRLGITVLRQGDMFAIRTPYSTEDLRRMSAVFLPKEWGAGRFYGTAHYADEMAQLPDGTMLGRGVMRHDPRLNREDRPPDHHPLTLEGRRWWLVVRNTVPVVVPPPVPPEPAQIRFVDGDYILTTMRGQTWVLSGDSGGQVVFEESNQ